MPAPSRPVRDRLLCLKDKVSPGCWKSLKESVCDTMRWVLMGHPRWGTVEIAEVPHTPDPARGAVAPKGSAKGPASLPADCSVEEEGLCHDCREGGDRLVVMRKQASKPSNVG
jgi:hypothetical protein